MGANTGEAVFKIGDGFLTGVFTAAAVVVAALSFIFFADEFKITIFLFGDTAGFSELPIVTIVLALASEAAI